MTDPNSHQPSLRRRSVSESDTDSMASATNPRIYPNRFIPSGRTESQPNVSGLGSISKDNRQLQARKSSLESRAAGVLKRFEGMKLEINEWKTSAES